VTPSRAQLEGFEIVDVARVWSGHPVNFALETVDDRQYVAFYDDERRMTVAMRSIDSSRWRFHRLPSKLGWDSHDDVVLAVDTAGFIHVSGNMHGDRLLYFRSRRAHDISVFERPGMVGDREKHVSYPRFLQAPDGRLLFQYRDGKSGDGVQIFNEYDVRAKSWRRLLSEPLLDGDGRMSPYVSGPLLGPDGGFHLVWMWRDTPNGDTNHDISYARSADLSNWVSAAGEKLRLPLRPESVSAVIDPVPVAGGLAGIAFGLGWDTAGTPVVTYSKYDGEGKSQAYNARWEKGMWRVVQTSDWRYRWELGETGSLIADIVVRPLHTDFGGRLVQSFEHVRRGRGIWVLNPETLLPNEVLEPSTALRAIQAVESGDPGMEVRELIQDRTGEFFLRWETLPTNRDRKRRRPYPEASMLRVYRRTTTGGGH
ncbi:MAG: BNR repeat-containing protein, partial [Acidobacteriota bacterium]|nr:BNR repeat-containing protein [Acidobacteriota bacterium]